MAEVKRTVEAGARSSLLAYQSTWAFLTLQNSLRDLLHVRSCTVQSIDLALYACMNHLYFEMPDHEFKFLSTQ